MNVNVFTLLTRNIVQGKSGVLYLASRKPCTHKFGYISCATIVSKANRDPDYKRPPPFPYKEKDYTIWHRQYDFSSNRFDENTKVIVVDGPIAVGKTAFAKQLAEELDMLFIPEANMDTFYINKYGFDQRSLNNKLPPNLKRTDEKSFCQDPKHITSASFQFNMFELRLSMYVDALAHLLNTGQGVVMVRSVYSDVVFVEAMAKEGYIRSRVLKGYYETINEGIHELVRPHLQIYLDTPVSTVQERIRQRGHSWEVNSKALTKSYLQAMEDAYKRKYLPNIEKHAELLIYDWTQPGDMELIIEDIERLDFDKYTVYDSKMKDWRFPKEQAIGDLRQTVTNTRAKKNFMGSFDIPLHDCPELYLSGEETEIYEELIVHGPGNRYMEGYNADMGDTSLLFKTKESKPQFPYWH